MTDTLGRELRAAFDARLESVSTDRAARLRSRDYDPRSGVVGAWQAFGAAAMAALVAVVVIALTLSSGAQSAFAGWTPTPRQASAAALALARLDCGNPSAAAVLASETRGPYTAISYLKGGVPWECITEGHRVIVRESTVYPPRLLVKPAAGRVASPFVLRTETAAVKARLNVLRKRDGALFPRIDTVKTYERIVKSSANRRIERTMRALVLGADALTTVSGTVGAGVSGVTFELRDGTEVKATVGNGWYLAWWPGSSRHDAVLPTAIRVTTATGTVAAPYSPRYLSGAFGPCLALQSSTCSFAGLSVDVVRGVSARLTAEFGLFRQLAPVTLPDWAKHGPLALLSEGERSYGLDPAQIRAVSFGGSTKMWAIPGNEGLCLRLTDLSDTGEAGACSSLSYVLRHGVVNFTSAGIFGIVPDGNRTVTLHLQGHRVAQVPVKHNLFLVEPPGGEMPRVWMPTVSTLTFKNADGRVVSNPLPPFLRAAG